MCLYIKDPICVANVSLIYYLLICFCIAPHRSEFLALFRNNFPTSKLHKYFSTCFSNTYMVLVNLILNL